MLALAIASVTFGLESFILSSHFMDGGVTGISILAAELPGFSISMGLILFNLPFIFIGYKHLGKDFAIKSLIGIIGISLALSIVHLPPVTNDKFLAALFGGVFIGLGIGLAMRAGGVLDGTEIAAVIVSRRIRYLRVGELVMLVNVLIFGAGAFVLGFDSALYSMVTYFAASRAIDFLIHGIEEYTAVIIVSDEHEAIRQMITRELGKGVTLLHGERGFGKRGEGNNTKVIYSVVTRLETTRLFTSINTIDPHAFIIHHPVGDALGGFVKQRRL